MLEKHISREAMVTETMLAMGIPANVKGYQYIREGILLSMENLEMVNYITKLLYPRIAKRYQTTPSRVERSIRHAIDIAWQRGNMLRMNNLYGYLIDFKSGKPTNSEFIALVADVLRLNTMDDVS